MKGKNTGNVNYLPTQMAGIVFPVYNVVKEKDVEKNDVILFIVLCLVFRYHYCFMYGICFIS